MTPAPMAQQQMANPEIAQLLSQLKDPAIPEAIGVWPPAIGWLGLGVLLLIAILALTFWLWHNRQNTRYKRIAQHKLNGLLQESSHHHFAANCATLLKQTFITASPGSRNLIAGLYGSNWVKLLYATCNLSKLPLEQQQALASICGESKYDKKFQIDRNNLEKACRYWITRHKIPPLRQLQTTIQNCSNAIQSLGGA